MKVIKTEYLVSSSEPERKEVFDKAIQEIYTAIASVKWPIGSDKFTIYPGKHANGVKPIKNSCVEALAKCGWTLEHKLDYGAVSTRDPGAIDAFKRDKGYSIAFEWETGNISSTHRALNKMALCLIRDKILGGVLVLPSRNTYNYVTDRIGNFKEIEPYFDLWKHLRLDKHFLAVVEIEHDEISYDVPKIEKGTDGRALR